MSVVALRKESVDRNGNRTFRLQKRTRSLSARRAWIEIVTRYRPTPKPVVALRKESVDRNANNIRTAAKWARRSPQGERG